MKNRSHVISSVEWFSQSLTFWLLPIDLLFIWPGLCPSNFKYGIFQACLLGFYSIKLQKIVTWHWFFKFYSNPNRCPSQKPHPYPNRCPTMLDYWGWCVVPQPNPNHTLTDVIKMSRFQPRENFHKIHVAHRVTKSSLRLYAITFQGGNI